MKVALDIDDVIAGYVIGVHRTFKKELVPHDHWKKDGNTGKLLLRQDVEGFEYLQEYLDECEHNKDFWYNLPIITLPSYIDWTVNCYITSSPENMLGVREAWLKRHGFQKAPVVHCKQKHVTMERLGIDLLIDDRLSTVEKVREHGLKALHFQPWYSTHFEKDSVKSLELKSLKPKLKVLNY